MLPLVITVDPLVYGGQELDNGAMFWSPSSGTGACRIKRGFISRYQQHITVNGNLALKLHERLRERSGCVRWLQRCMGAWLHPAAAIAVLKISPLNSSSSKCSLSRAFALSSTSFLREKEIKLLRNLAMALNSCMFRRPVTVASKDMTLCL